MARAMTAPRSSQMLDVVLAPVHRVEVRVVDKVTQRPIAGARVIALDRVINERRSFGFQSGEVFVSAVRKRSALDPTDADGRTWIASVPERWTLALIAEADGY